MGNEPLRGSERGALAPSEHFGVDVRCGVQSDYSNQIQMYNSALFMGKQEADTALMSTLSSSIEQVYNF